MVSFSELFNLSHYSFSFYAVPSILAGLLIAFLGLSVLLWERGSLISGIFCALTSCTAFWLIGYGFVFLTHDSSVAYTWISLFHVAISLIPGFLVLFALIATRHFPQMGIYAALTFFIAFSIYAIGTASRTFLQGVYEYSWGFYAKYGIAAWPFLIFFFVSMAWSLRLLWKGYQEADSDQSRARLKALMTTFAVGYLATIDYFPAFGIPVYPVGYAAIMMFVIMMARIILKYHLVDLTPAFAAHQILDTMQGAVLVTDLEGKIRVANRAVCSALKYRKSELLGKAITEIVEMPLSITEPASKKSPTLRDQLILWRGSTVYDHPMSWKTKKGEKIRMSVAASILKDKHSIHGIVYVGLDVSDQQRLQEERDRFFNLSLDMIWIADFAGHFKQLNPAWGKILGWLPEDLEDKSYLDLIHPDDREGIVQEWQKLIQGIATTTFENRWLSKGGTYKWLVWTATPLPEFQMIYGSARDVTANKIAKEMRLRLAAIVEGTSDAILAIALDGTMTSCNGGAEKTYGYRAGELIGRPVELLIPEDQRNDFKNAFERVRKGARIEYYEVTRIRKDGQQIILNSTLSPIRDETGKIIGISSIGRDVTRIKQAEDALRMKKDLDTKSQFISMVSHELRTPLTAIRMSIEILNRDKFQGEQERKEWLDMAEKNVKRLSRLIDDVLNFQKLEAGRIGYEWKLQDINSLILDVAKTFQPLAQEKNLRIDLDLDESLPEIRMDSDKITQVMINIVGNALKFTDQGSISIKTSQKAHFIFVAVQDTGQGIREEDLPKLFVAFSQIRHEKKTGGTGLGLAISKKIIEQHGGDIMVQSQIGHGATFTFSLPVQTVLELEENSKGTESLR